MALEHAQISAGGRRAGVTTAEIIDRLSHFDGPPEQFLVNLLAVQCRLAAAEAGGILRTREGSPEVLAVFPPPDKNAPTPVWLAQALEASAQVTGGGTTVIRPLVGADAMYGAPARRNLVMVPILTAGSVRGLGAFVVDTGDSTALAHCRERLELSISLLSLYEMRLTLQRRQVDLRRLQVALETLAAVNEHDRFAAAAMAMCNETAARWGCERVGLGFLKGRYVHLKALSHTEKINRKMKLVQEIEATMEECLDQDVEVLYPAPQEATYVSRSAAEHSRLHGPMTILSLPLRRGGDVVGALAVERPLDNAFTLEEAEALRLTCDLCTARLHNLHESDKWVGARAAGAVRKGAAVALGPKHTWLKVAAILIFAFVVGIFTFEGDYEADASFVIDAQQRQIVPAPFDGYIEQVLVETGDEVVAGQTILGMLETTDLQSALIRARADLAAALTESATAMRDGKIAEAQIAEADAEKARAEISLLERRIGEASITSPISGTVVSPDLKRRIRGHVEIGEAMFEVAPIDALRAELSVPEDEIAEVVVALDQARSEGRELHGQLASEAKPGTYIDFVVERVNPVAEPEEKANVFKVRARLDGQPYRLVPGMKGVAKVHLGRRSYAYLWTRKLVNWVRMKLWV